MTDERVEWCAGQWGRDPSPAEALLIAVVCDGLRTGPVGDPVSAGEARLIRAIMGEDPTAADRLAAICRAEWLRRAAAALRVAAAELEWGHREMSGRPPDHWTVALDEVRRVLACGPPGTEPDEVGP